MAKNRRKKVRIEFCPMCGKWRFCRIEGEAVINAIIECRFCSANIGVPRDINRKIGLVMMRGDGGESEIYMGIKELEIGVLLEEFMVRLIPDNDFYKGVFRTEVELFEKLVKGEKI